MSSEHNEAPRRSSSALQAYFDDTKRAVERRLEAEQRSSALIDAVHHLAAEIGPLAVAEVLDAITVGLRKGVAQAKQKRTRQGRHTHKDV